MPEGIPYASSNVIAGTSPDLNYVGKHCFAYSGKQESASSSSADVELLNFVTGADYIVGKMYFCENSRGGERVMLDIKINGISVMAPEWDSTPVIAESPLPYKIILPPYTNVQMLWGVESVTKSGYGWFVGKVYK